MPIAVVAIGGNSLVKPGERGTMEEQRANLSVTCEGIAAVMAAGYRVGGDAWQRPQVGDALLRSELAAAQVPPLPLDACVAETQATIGYLLQQILQETLQRHGLRRPVVTMVTQVLVSRARPRLAQSHQTGWPFLLPGRSGTPPRRVRAGRWSRTPAAAIGAWCPHRSPRRLWNSPPSRARSPMTRW